MAESEKKETTEIKTEAAVAGNEAKEKALKGENPEKKFEKKPRRRPVGGGKFGHPSSAKSGPFSDSLADRFGDALANKLKRGIEDDIKRKIKAAQSDPAVQRASAKYGK